MIAFRIKNRNELTQHEYEDTYVKYKHYQDNHKIRFSGKEFIIYEATSADMNSIILNEKLNVWFKNFELEKYLVRNVVVSDLFDKLNEEKLHVTPNENWDTARNAFDLRYSFYDPSMIMPESNELVVKQDVGLVVRLSAENHRCDVRWSISRIKSNNITIGPSRENSKLYGFFPYTTETFVRQGLERLKTLLKDEKRS